MSSNTKIKENLHWVWLYNSAFLCCGLWILIDLNKVLFIQTSMLALVQQVLKFHFYVWSFSVMCHLVWGLEPLVPSRLWVALSEQWKTQTAHSSHLCYPLLENVNPFNNEIPDIWQRGSKIDAIINSYQASVCLITDILGLHLPLYCFWTMFIAVKWGVWVWEGWIIEHCVQGQKTWK